MSHQGRTDATTAREEKANHGNFAFKLLQAEGLPILVDEFKGWELSEHGRSRWHPAHEAAHGKG